jgi:hypothetical protein
VVAFRLHAHHLDERLEAGSLLEAAAACGVQDSPPGSAAMALHARVIGVEPDSMGDALEDRSLFHTWAMRGAPFFFPTADLAVFTTGVLPHGQSARRQFILGVEQALDRLDMSLDDATDHTRAVIRNVLSGRALAINELGEELATAVAKRLPKPQRSTWDAVGPYAKNQSLGEGVVHFCLRLLTLEQIVCFTHRDGQKLPFVLVDEWLGNARPEVEADVARAEIARRYLRCYGPSTRADYGSWLGVTADDASKWWKLIEDELQEVRVDGRSRWVLAEDLQALRSPPEARGVRLLPPRDPLMQLRDRETLLDKRWHRHVWKSVGEPGTVLGDGQLVATYRPRKSGKKLSLTVSSIARVTSRQRSAIEDEAEAVAPLRGCSSCEVTFES